MSKSSTVILFRKDAELVFSALDDIRCELETFEHDVSWYTASPKMMDRLEKAMNAVKEALK